MGEESGTGPQENTWRDASHVTGGIRIFQKVHAYLSGFLFCRIIRLFREPGLFSHGGLLAPRLARIGKIDWVVNPCNQMIIFFR